MRVVWLFFNSCLRCKHYQPLTNDIKFNDGHCLKYTRVLENRTFYEYADKMRQTEKKCGIIGRDFEERETFYMNK